MSFWIRGFGAGETPASKLTVEMATSALPNEFKLRKKTAKPSAIAAYLIEFLGRVAREVPPKFTHTARRDQPDAPPVRGHAGRGTPTLISGTPHQNGAVYRYRTATFEISGPAGGTWWATIKFRNQEVDVEGRSFDSAVEAAKEWLDAAPELNELRAMREASIPPEDDPDYIVQGAYSDSTVSDSMGYNDEAEAVHAAQKLLRSPYFEGDYVTVITRDGELVWDSRQQHRRASERRGVRAPAHRHEGPYTIEVRNEVTGGRQHWSKSPKETIEDARESAIGHAARSRKFVEYVILDRRGTVVERHRGTQ